MKTRRSATTLLCLTVFAGSCDAPESDHAAEVQLDELDEGHVANAVRPPAKLRPAAVTAPTSRRAPQTMPGARAAFQEVVALIRTSYVDGPPEDDVLWTAATEGVLSRLIQVEGAEINTLLSPRDLEEMRIGTKGQLVGVGVVIELVAGMVVIQDVIPDGPAAAVDLQPGDRILGIDGERIQAMPLGEVVDRIRGPEATSVKLFVQRDTEEWDVDITRAQIAFPSIEGGMLDGTVGYIRINQFTAPTAGDLVAQLEALESENMQSLVLDLRDCPGGLLDASIEVAELFLPPQRRIMSLHGPETGDKVIESERMDRWDTLPLVAVVGPRTASGAEILASALQHHQRARIIGERTMGKGTVESIHELENGWGLKLSVNRFHSAADEPMLGRGVTPDIAIPSGGENSRIPVDEIVPASDPQLAAALSLLRGL